MYEYRAECVKVVDGDTVHLAVDLGMDVQLKDTFRLAGINCPEMSTGKPGEDAKLFTATWMTSHNDLVVVKTVKDKREKYGRYLGWIYSLDQTQCLNDLLIQTGNAKEYNP